MIRAKSRNFILIVCAILLLLILGVTAFYSAIRVSKSHSDEEKMLQIMNNIVFSSSKVKVSGSGNFDEITPKIDRLSVYDYRVKLNKLGDKVEFVATFCNKNDVDVKFVNLLKEEFTCLDSMENDISCDNNFSFIKTRYNKKELVYGDMIKSNTCFDVVFNTEYVNEVDSNLTYILSNKNSLELAVVEK